MLTFASPPNILLTIMISLWLACVAASSAQAQSVRESDELFLFRPSTPERQIRGAILAEKLDRPQLALGYLTDLLDSQPSPEVLLQLRKQFGPGAFLRLSAIPELQPTSRELLNLINEASRQDLTNVAAIDGLINELGQSKQQTVEASLRILSLESSAVVPLLNADPATPHGDLAGRLLKKYVPRFKAGLLKALPNSDEETQTRILELLAESADSDIVTDLVRYRFSESTSVAAAADMAIHKLARTQGPLPSQQQAVDNLMSQAIDLIRQAGLRFPNDQQRADDRTLQAVPADQPVVYGAGFLSRAVNLTDLAGQIALDDQQLLAVKMVAELTEQSTPPVWPTGFDVPETAVSDEAPAETDRLALQIAADTENTAAILSLLRRDSAVPILRQEPQVMRQLLMHFDPRIRLLTAGLLKVADVPDYRLDAALASAINGSTSPEATIIDTRRGEGPTVSAVISGAGYATADSRTGQGGFELAVNQLGSELILIHSNVLRWPLSQTISNLRADYRTKWVPIVIYGPERDRAGTKLVRSSYPAVWFVTEPISDKIRNVDVLASSTASVIDSTIVTERFRLEGIPQAVLSKEERQQMIRFARGLQ